MGLFDFVENFFFIGLALLFVLVLLLVYHFKQRMNSVEKKGDNMFDLMTNVVRELRNIRTNMLDGTPASQVVTSAVTQPSVYTKVESESESESEFDVETGSGSEIEDDEDSDSESEHDGITYQIIDTKAKVVVSDESDTDSEESDSSDGYSTDDESTDGESTGIVGEEEVPLDVDVVEPVVTDSSVDADVDSPLVAAVKEEDVVEQAVEDVPLEIDSVVESSNDVCEVQSSSSAIQGQGEDDIQPINRGLMGNTDKLNSYKKMNVNQLKALAIQHGIQGDTSKLKKTALIEFLLEKQV